MKQSPKKNPAKDIRRSDFTVAQILLDFADTTWRIAVPVALFTGIGIFVDLKTGTKPWVTFLGVVVGFTIAILLVKKQLAVANRSDKS